MGKEPRAGQVKEGPAAEPNDMMNNKPGTGPRLPKKWRPHYKE
jgi:hypothetical protein